MPNTDFAQTTKLSRWWPCLRRVWANFDIWTKSVFGIVFTMQNQCFFKKLHATFMPRVEITPLAEIQVLLVKRNTKHILCRLHKTPGSLYVLPKLGFCSKASELPPRMIQDTGARPGYAMLCYMQC